ncbi:MAG: acyltransferase [Turneriella sp.]|nr:acyltransferase [Turneriella sp.]
MPRTLTDAAKVIAAIAVVAIHATSGAELHYAAHQEIASWDFVAVALNQWARFSVPLFLYLSGYGLAKSSASIRLAGYLQFLRQRVPGILVPYLFFASLALLPEFYGFLRQGKGELTAFLAIAWRKFYTGTADYHLYFLVILLQCYLLFPLWQELSRHATFYRFIVWLSLLLVTALLYRGSSEFLLAQMGLRHPGWHAAFAIYWLPYFMLGIAHAHQPPQNRHGILFALAVFLGFILVLWDYVRSAAENLPPDYYNHFSRPAVVFYTLSTIYWLHTFRNFSARWLDGVSQYARFTFTVYLIHPTLLRGWLAIFPQAHSLVMWLLTTATAFATSYALTLLVQKLAARQATTKVANQLARLLGLR